MTRLTALAFLVVLSAFACSAPPPDASSPEGAVALMAACVNNSDYKCLYENLDRDSRWSVQSIHKTLAKIRQLVEKTYPEKRQSQAYGRWSDEASAADDAELFEMFCKKRQCLKEVASRFGPAVNIEQKDPQNAVVETTRGKHLQMSEADGRWGLSMFQGELSEIKIRLLDRLPQIEQNAAVFEQQKLAGTQEEKKGDYPNDN